MCIHTYTHACRQTHTYTLFRVHLLARCHSTTLVKAIIARRWRSDDITRIQTSPHSGVPLPFTSRPPLPLSPAQRSLSPPGPHRRPSLDLILFLLLSCIQDPHENSLYNGIFQWKSNRNDCSKVSRLVWGKLFAVVVAELLMKQPS